MAQVCKTTNRGEHFLYAEAEVCLYRNCRWIDDGDVVATGDKLIVRHFDGNEDYVVVRKSSSELMVERIVTHVDFATAACTESFVDDIPREHKEDLLKIYKRMLSEAKGAD